jgi:hypothetical protein
MPAKKAAKKIKVAAKKTAEKKPIEKKEEVSQKGCEHCAGTGKCAAGEPYDKGHHQMFGSKVRLTSCAECLEALGEHRNSKKLVACRICRGTGKVRA